MSTSQVESNDDLEEMSAVEEALRHGLGYAKVLDGDFACPVEPSSGVDEDALAEVICLALNHRDGGEECEDDYRVARAVAAWLNGQGGGSSGES